MPQVLYYSSRIYIYFYNLEEQLKLDKFLEENLEKYIWLLLCLPLLPMDERWSQQVWIQGQGAFCLMYHCDMTYHCDK